MEACEAREHGSDSKQNHQVEGETPWITRSQSNKGAWSALEKIEAKRGREEPRSVGPSRPASPFLSPMVLPFGR
jgi:hypothetical protein